MTFLLYYEINDLGYSTVWGQLSVTAFVWVFFAASMVPETKGKTLEEIQKEFQNDYDVPDFLAAADYFSGNESDDGEEGKVAEQGGLGDELGITEQGLNMTEAERLLGSSSNDTAAASSEVRTGSGGANASQEEAQSPMHRA